MDVFFPMHALMALSTTKDTLFAALVLLYICELIDVLEYRCFYWKNIWRCCRFILISFMMAIFRNNGIYVLISGSIVVLIFLSQSIKKAVGILSIVFLMYFLYCGPVMGSLGVEKGNMREALSIVIQPLARVYNVENDDISVEDKKRIENIFGNPEVIWYEAHKSDAAKGQFDTAFFTSELKDNIKLFIKLGGEFPNVYIDAWLANTYGNWYPYEKLPDNTTYRMLFEMPESGKINSYLPRLYDTLYAIGRESTYQNIPVVRLFFSTGMVCWLLFWATMRLIAHKKYLECLICVPLWCLFFTIMLGPVALFRYTYPLLLCLPVIFALMRKERVCEERF